jgi:hypothetical protein
MRAGIEGQAPGMAFPLDQPLSRNLLFNSSAQLPKAGVQGGSGGVQCHRGQESPDLVR